MIRKILIGITAVMTVIFSACLTACNDTEKSRENSDSKNTNLTQKNQTDTSPATESTTVTSDTISSVSSENSDKYKTRAYAKAVRITLLTNNFLKENDKSDLDEIFPDENFYGRYLEFSIDDYDKNNPLQEEIYNSTKESNEYPGKCFICLMGDEDNPHLFVQWTAEDNNGYIGEANTRTNEVRADNNIIWKQVTNKNAETDESSSAEITTSAAENGYSYYVKKSRIATGNQNAKQIYNKISEYLTENPDKTEDDIICEFSAADIDEENQLQKDIRNLLGDYEGYIYIGKTPDYYTGEKYFVQWKTRENSDIIGQYPNPADNDTKIGWGTFNDKSTQN